MHATKRTARKNIESGIFFIIIFLINLRKGAKAGDLFKCMVKL